MLGDRLASQHVDDVGEQGAVSRFVTRDGVEQLRGPGHCKRKHQPVRLGGRERRLGRRGGGVSITQGQVRDAGEQMRLDERERGGRSRCATFEHVSKCVQRIGRVSRRDADRCARVANETVPGRVRQRIRLAFHAPHPAFRGEPALPRAIRRLASRERAHL